MNEYENTMRIRYGGDSELDGATFIPRHEGCGLIVKADETVKLDHRGQPVGANATCKRHGRVEMLFEGYL